MSKSAKLGEYTFNGVTFGEDSCTQGFNINDQIQELTYYCGGEEESEDGPRQVTVTANHVIEDDQHALMNALTPGAEGPIVLHPGGNTTGLMSLTATAKVTSRNMSNPANGLRTIDITYKLTGIQPWVAAS